MRTAHSLMELWLSASLVETLAANGHFLRTSKMSFNGKVVLITGAGSGIGANTAIHLSKLGASVAIVDRDAEKLNDVQQKIVSLENAAAPLKILADVTTDAERIIDSTVAHFGKLDVLVNCAGIAELGSIEDLTIESYDRIMNVNVRSVLSLSQLAIKHLEVTKGNIVNLASVYGIMAVPIVLPYCMSKAAVSHFTRCAALDLAKKGIRVNAVNPGVTDTPIFKTVGWSDEMIQEHFAQLAQKYPLGRIGRVDDISKAIAFIASDDASFITGQTLVVDGGISLTTA